MKTGLNMNQAFCRQMQLKTKKLKKKPEKSRKQWNEMNERYNRIMESVSHGNDVFSTIQPGCEQTLSFETVSNEMRKNK